MIELLEEIIKEANVGKIVIDGDNFSIAFHTIIYRDDIVIFNNNQSNKLPCLTIKNMDKFIDKVEEYVSAFLETERGFPPFSKDVNKNRVKMIVSYLFANATTEDFTNPITLVDRNIAFLLDDTFIDLSKEVRSNQLDHLEGSNILVSNTKQSVFMETPNRIDISIAKEEDGEVLLYPLPSISYGIKPNSNGDKECFIYTILQPHTKLENSENQVKYSKKIGRELYKLNSGVTDNETEEYKLYSRGESDYYPENISDVSPSAVMSLAIFSGLLTSKNIFNIKAVPYLPVRFISRQIIAGESDNYEELNNRNIKLQQNITDKFIRTFNRLKYHCCEMNIQSFPYEVSEFLEIKLNSPISKINNSILNNVYFSSNEILNTRGESK